MDRGCRVREQLDKGGERERGRGRGNFFELLIFFRLPQKAKPLFFITPYKENPFLDG